MEAETVQAPSATNNSSVCVLKFKKNAYYVNEPSRLSPKVPSKYRNLEILEIYPHQTARHLQSRLCPSVSQNKKSWIQKKRSPLTHPISSLFILKLLSSKDTIFFYFDELFLLMVSINRLLTKCSVKSID